MPAVLTPPAAPATVSPAEYVRTLSPEDRMAALAALLDAIPPATGPVPVEFDGRVLGHFLPRPKSDPERLKALLAATTPEDDARMRQALRSVGKNSVSLDDVLAEIGSPVPSEGR